MSWDAVIPPFTQQVRAAFLMKIFFYFLIEKFSRAISSEKFQIYAISAMALTTRDSATFSQIST
jgi:hypothetical protein